MNTILFHSRCVLIFRLKLGDREGAKLLCCGQHREPESPPQHRFGCIHQIRAVPSLSSAFRHSLFGNNKQQVNVWVHETHSTELLQIRYTARHDLSYRQLEKKNLTPLVKKQI